MKLNAHRIVIASSRRYWLPDPQFDVEDLVPACEIIDREFDAPTPEEEDWRWLHVGGLARRYDRDRLPRPIQKLN